MQQVKDRMNANIEIISGDITVVEMAKIMAEKKIGSLLVQKRGKIIGIVTETDLVQKVMASNKDLESVRCEEVMSSPLKTINLSKRLFDAADIMDKHHIRHLAVEENGEVIGVISVRDLIHPEYTDGEGW